MNHIGTQTVETPRLILRRFTLADAPDMFRNWASDEDVTKYLVWPTHETVDVSRQVLGSWVTGYERDDFYQWAMELKELGQPIGSISAVSINEGAQSAHIGYCMGKAWWGRGLMAEALGAVMDYFFDRVGASRVEARHDTHNPASGAVMRKCGMKYEGTLRKSDRNNQGICDAAWYGILASERNRG